MLLKRLFYNFINFMYRWLPVFFSCHQRKDRSFYYRGFQFPICACCTGILFGFLLSPFLVMSFAPPIWIYALLLLPLLIDGTIQRISVYESNNPTRLITGIFFGVACAGLLFLFLASGFMQGYRIGKKLQGWQKRNWLYNYIFLHWIYINDIYIVEIGRASCRERV